MMKTELQNKVWSLLSKEFKEEVKDCYKTAKAQHKENFHLEVEAALIRERIIMLEYFFGIHNLTSDEEGKELLTCEKYKVEEALNYCDELDSISGSHNMLNWGKQMIVYLFGSKCLLDETKQETKQETKSFQNGNTSNYSGNHFADASKMADTRLHIAAMVMAGALANKNITIGCGAFEDNLEYITKTALMYADALIAECESSAEPLCPAKKGGTK